MNSPTKLKYEPEVNKPPAGVESDALKLFWTL